MKLNQDQINHLLSPEAIRERCQRIWEISKTGGTNFQINEDKIEACSDFVLEVIRDNYPTLEIPFHSRWGHFQAGNVDRLSNLNEKLSGFSKEDQARAKLDLVVVSVLLDAGAGATWKYNDKANNCIIGRSEGLAIASFDMFIDGIFSLDNSLKVDAEALINFSSEDLIKGFQVSESNPLVGIEGRVKLINNLGKTLKENSNYFVGERPGGLMDHLIEKHGKDFEVRDILIALLFGMGPIWPGRLDANGINLGDCWSYEFNNDNNTFENLVVFHKLSQWLTYSLVNPMIEGGCHVTGAQKLTGLAEYRNGGLFVDMDVLQVRDSQMLTKAHKPDSSFIVEWRALTVCLLDKVGKIVREKLNFSESEFPLAKVLEGGTWHAGRRVAKEKRDMATPPISIDSDGTVF